MPRAENGMKVCCNPNCIHNGKPQPVSNFGKDNGRLDKLNLRCKDCCKKYDLSRKDQEKIQVKFKKCTDPNCPHKDELQPISNFFKSRQNKDEYEYKCKECSNRYKREKRIEYQREYRKLDNQSPAKYNPYFNKLKIFEEVHQDPNNPELIQVRCKNSNCRKWFNPTKLQVRNRLSVFRGRSTGENNFYCSDECKHSCSIFNSKKDPFEKKTKSTSSCRTDNLQEELREMVFELDDYTCQMCGRNQEEEPDLVLHCHHVIPMAEELMFASDVDNCLTLCEECHKKVHSLSECKLPELKKKAQEQRENIKQLIENNKTS